jgi:tetratricopeptide (TPR) repeat protein
VPLRLTLAGGVVGLELYEPVQLEPFMVEDLAWSLPRLRFPVDLSGGVESFRHRRGELTRLEFGASFAALASYARPRLREALGQLQAAPQLWPLDNGVGIGLLGELGSLAFDLQWAPAGPDARWVVSNARGVGRVGVPLGHALRVADTLFAGLAERRGRVLTLTHVAQRLCRHLAPTLGARTPATRSSNIERLSIGSDGLTLALAENGEQGTSAAGLRAIELARLCSAADDALASGDLDAARAGYLSALERAPRHPELAALVAQIDVTHADRAEGALGMLVDCLPVTQFGLTGAVLLARVGDLAGAREAVQRAAGDEPYAPLAAGLWQQLAELSVAGAERREALDRAVACAPGLASARWARFEARVEWGDERGALADAESLEAAASGAAQRHATLLRAAGQLVGRGLSRGAGQLFERALRYVPSDPHAICGLGRALLGQGRTERAMALFERAVELGEAKASVSADALIELSRLLAEHCGDHPQAIARVAQVPPSSDRRYEALALEGRWRAALGDLRGASLAYGRLRDACELAGRSVVLAQAASWLTEAAQFEDRSLGDLAAAERHLASALRLAPRNPRVRRLYRQTAAALAKRKPP